MGDMEELAAAARESRARAIMARDPEAPAFSEGDQGFLFGLGFALGMIGTGMVLNLILYGIIRLGNS